MNIIVETPCTNAEGNLCRGIAMFLEVRGLLLRATKVGSKHSNCSNSQAKCRLRSIENKLAFNRNINFLFTSVRFKWDIQQIKITRSLIHRRIIFLLLLFHYYFIFVSRMLEKFLKLTTISLNFTILKHIFHYYIFISQFHFIRNKFFQYIKLSV